MAAVIIFGREFFFGAVCVWPKINGGSFIRGHRFIFHCRLLLLPAIKIMAVNIFAPIRAPFIFGRRQIKTATIKA